MSKRPRPADEELAHLPAAEIATRVRSGQLAAVEVLDTFARRIERLNPALNALVAERIPAARAEAQAIDDAVKAGRDPGRWAGVPFTTKEMVSAEGLPVTAGSLRRRQAVATRDATFVARLRDEGALLVGVTNQSELGLWWESFNPVYGRTNNPYNPKHTAGGSSGGEGAMAGGGLNGFGVGSDMGGSIRLPALFCGVFGHKPTHGYVPVSGHFPIDYSSERIDNPPSTRMISIGPMSRHATDLLPLLGTMSGACPDDDNSCDPDLGSIESMEGKRVFFLEDPRIRLASSTTAPQSAAVRRAARALGSAGATVAQWNGPTFKHAMSIFSAMLAELGEEGAGLEHLLSGRERMGLAREASRMARGKSTHAITTLFVVLGERFAKPNPKQTLRLAAYGRELRQEIDDILGDDAVLILPTFPRPAPRHATTLLRPFDLAYTGLFNATDHPVTATPMGIDPTSGLPTGIQIVGRRGNDHLTISAAVELEAQGVAAWIPPRPKT